MSTARTSKSWLGLGQLWGLIGNADGSANASAHALVHATDPVVPSHETHNGQLTDLWAPATSDADSLSPLGTKLEDGADGSHGRGAERSDAVWWGLPATGLNQSHVATEATEVGLHAPSHDHLDGGHPMELSHAADPGFAPDGGNLGGASAAGPSADGSMMTTAALAAPMAVTTTSTTDPTLDPWISNPIVVNAFDTTAFGSEDPSGLAFLPGASPGTGTLLLSDSEVDESPLFATNNLYYLSQSGTFDHSTSLESFTHEPTGLAYDPNNGHLFISDDDSDGVFEVAASNPGVKLNFFSTRPYATDDEDVAYDPATNHLLVIEGSTGNNNAHTIFETTTSGTLIQSIVLPAPIVDPEALAYDPAHQVFY